MSVLIIKDDGSTFFSFCFPFLLSPLGFLTGLIVVVFSLLLVLVALPLFELLLDCFVLTGFVELFDLFLLAVDCVVLGASVVDGAVASSPKVKPSGP
jgi:hypothetical protein